MKDLIEQLEKAEAGGWVDAAIDDAFRRYCEQNQITNPRLLPSKDLPQ